MIVKESLSKSFDKALLSVVEGLRTNDKVLIPFVVSLHHGTSFGRRTMNGVNLFRGSSLGMTGFATRRKRFDATLKL
jgi:hypothetical protein